MKKIIVIALLLSAFGMNSQAQMIGATNSQGGYHPADNGNTSLYRPTGSVFQFELGYSNTLAFGYQFNPYLRASLGVGLLAEYEWDNACLPVFAEVRLGTPRYRFSIYLDVKVGYNFIDCEYRSVYAAQLGVTFRQFSIGAGIVNFGRNKAHDYYGPNLSIGWSIPVSNLRSKLF